MQQFVKYWKYLLFSTVLIISFIALYYVRNPLIPKLQINNQVFTLEYAVTTAEQQKGLSGRNPLPEYHGMIFIYRDKQQHTFWMKDMKFALDFIWIDDNKVVDLTENVPPPQPGQQLKTYSPKQPVNRVLEVNAGTVKKVGINIGDTVTFLRK
jgi:uncharacterized protein